MIFLVKSQDMYTYTLENTLGSARSQAVFDFSRARELLFSEILNVINVTHILEISNYV